MLIEPCLKTWLEFNSHVVMRNSGHWLWKWRLTARLLPGQAQRAPWDAQVRAALAVWCEVWPWGAEAGLLLGHLSYPMLQLLAAPGKRGLRSEAAWDMLNVLRDSESSQGHALLATCPVQVVAQVNLSHISVARSNAWGVWAMHGCCSTGSGLAMTNWVISGQNRPVSWLVSAEGTVRSPPTPNTLHCIKS